MRCFLFNSAFVFLLVLTGTATVAAAAPAPAANPATSAAATAPTPNPAPPPPPPALAMPSPDRVLLRTDPPLYGLFRPAFPPIKGAVLLLQEPGQHPDSPYVVAPLRQALPRYGFATLVVELETGVSGDLQKNLDSGLQFLEKQPLPVLALLVYARPYADTAALLERPSRNHRGALILIGADWTDGMEQLKKLSVLDIYAAKDYISVVRSALRRREWMKTQGLTHYRSWPMAGADHHYTGLQQRLAQVVRGFLEHVYEGESE